MMSGLENVLGNVYGDADDRPKKSDLSDVQDSIDALTGPSNDSVDQIDSQHDIFDSEGLTFLDEDTSFEAETLFDDNFFDAANDTVDAAPQRADWLASFPEGTAEQPDAANEPEDDVEASLGLETETPDTSLEPEDEQWLDDLFGTDEAETSIPGETAQTSTANISHGLGHRSPSLMELQKSAAEAVVAALTPQTVSVGVDWIRSDDDIVPSRGKGRRKANNLEIAPSVSLAPVTADLQEMPTAESSGSANAGSARGHTAPSSRHDDPINLFSPFDDGEPHQLGRFARKGRKPKDDASI